MCLALGGVGGEVDERIRFGLYQSCGIWGSVGRVIGLRWCRWGVGRGSGGMVLCLCEL